MQGDAFCFETKHGCRPAFRKGLASDGFTLIATVHSPSAPAFACFDDLPLGWAVNHLLYQAPNGLCVCVCVRSQSRKLVVALHWHRTRMPRLLLSNGGEARRPREQIAPAQRPRAPSCDPLLCSLSLPLLKPLWLCAVTKRSVVVSVSYLKQAKAYAGEVQHVQRHFEARIC